MPPIHFSVSQVRLAAACPRILYFDAAHTRAQGLKQALVSRIWKTSKDEEATASGSLFHAAIEQFNSRAAQDATVRQILSEPAQDELATCLLKHVYERHVNRDALFQKTGAQKKAFMAVLQTYITELAHILIHARSSGKSVEEIVGQMFGDKRRRMDVTFEVGPAGEEVHVTGILDYVFYDWRTAHNRIIDYKLTPADKPGNDLFQVCVYALMHHRQHGTQPDAAVLYLYPNRQMIEKRWEEVYAERHKVCNLLASMREWVAYDEKAHRGLKPPGEPIYCDVCRWDKECVSRLGTKHEGQRLSHWTDSRPAASTEPLIAVRDPAAAGAEDARGGKTAQPSPVSSPSAPVREDALWLGQTLDGERPVDLPRDALPTHMAVVGAAGSGKTWLAKVLAEEAISQQVPVLAIDPQGDLVQFLKRRDPGAVPADHHPQYNRFWQLAEPRIFTPGSSHGIRICLNPIRLPIPSELVAVPDPQRRREELDSLLSSVAGNLVSSAKAGGDSDCQRAFLFQVLQRLMNTTEDRSVNLDLVARAASDPDMVGIDDAERFIKKSEREKLARKLNGLLHGPSANLFTGGQLLDLDALLRPTRSGRVPLNVFYLNALVDDDQKQFFVAALAAEVYRWMVTTGAGKSGPQLLFYLDEARDYLPAGARKPPAKEPLLRLFAQGRKYGVACLLCTQSPRTVDFQAFGNCSTKIIGRLESSQDVDRVEEWFGKEGPAPSWLHNRKGAAPGTFVARWPEMSPALEGQTWKSRCLFSVHEGAWSPERVEQETHADPLHQAWFKGG